MLARSSRRKPGACVQVLRDPEIVMLAALVLDDWVMGLGSALDSRGRRRRAIDGKFLDRFARDGWLLGKLFVD